MVAIAREEAPKDPQTDAEESGVDAVVGVSFDYEEMAEGTLWVNVSETAVWTG